MAKTNNALVTYTDLSTMGLTPKGTPPTGNRIATVSFINSNYYVNQSASPYNTYSSLRCPPYQNIVAGPTNSGTMYYLTDYGGGNLLGFNSASEACVHTSGGSITVYWYGTFGNGTVIYLDSNGGNIDAGGFFSLNGYSFQTDVNAVYDYAVCASVAINVTSGIYPVSGPNNSAIVDVINNTGDYIYLFVKFNSAGVGTGFLPEFADYMEEPIRGNTYYLDGSWTNNYGYEIITGYLIIAANSTVAVTVNKSDGLGSGSYMRIGYALSSTGTITWL
jgi:hypothetical protein